MNWLNLHALPLPLVSAITGDLYHAKRQEQLAKYIEQQGLDPKKVVHFSVSDLIAPPRRRVLTNRYQDKIIKDVSSDIYRILGQAVHSFLAEHSSGEYIAEERLFFHLPWADQTVVISGEPDLVTPSGEIHDYKVVAVYSWQKAQEEGVKSEYTTQLNLYAYLRGKNNKQTTGLKNHFILRDFKLQETVQKGYPKAGIQVFDIPIWPAQQVEDYIQERIRLHVQAQDKFDDELPECTPYEMWEKPEAWAVRREGAARAAKLVRVAGQEGSDQAHAIAEDKNTRLKKGEKPFITEHRPGERTMCTSYCTAAGFCNINHEYQAAAFRSGGKEKVEEPAL